MEKKNDSERKIAQLQAFEQNLQNLLLQRQGFQSQLIEIETALEGVGKSKGIVYRMIGSIMVLADKEEINNDMRNKKELLSLRIGTVEKQEERLKEKASKLQSEVLNEIKNNKGGE